MKNSRVIDLFEQIKRVAWDHKSPTTINFYWNTGSYAAIFFGIQLFTGVVVSMWYINNLVDVFPALEAVYREIPLGWMFRFIHAMTASWFFFIVYIHMYKNMLFSNFLGPKIAVWQIGVIIYFLMIVTAFLGYVLPYGQMSLWAATVITNLVTAIPVVGDSIVIWIRGDYSIGGVTITRFFALHVILPFIIFAFVLLHIHFLHKVPSAEIKGLVRDDQATLAPYALWRDWYGGILLWIFFILGSLAYPSIFIDVDNYTIANPMVTPEHITPEWYLCMYYAIVRSVDDKLLGVLVSLGTIFIFALVPYFVTNSTDSKGSSVLSKLSILTIIGSQMLLTWLGTQPIEQPFITVTKLTVIIYFLAFSVLLI